MTDYNRIAELDVEKSCILYYADFLSIKNDCRPLTDSCKYFFVHGKPVHILYLAGQEPIFDEYNRYYRQACNDYKKIMDELNDEAANSFVNDICYIRAAGMVDAELMLYFAHIYSNKKKQADAIARFELWKRRQIYTHYVPDDQFDLTKKVEKLCTKYVKHAEQYAESRRRSSK